MMNASSRTTVVAGLALLLVVLYTFRFTGSGDYIPGFGKEVALHPVAGIAAFVPTESAGVITDRVAVIIEDRPLHNLIPIILHFSSVLGPLWPIILYTHTKNIAADSPAFQRAVKEKRVAIRMLPAAIQFTDHISVSKFLTRKWFWDQLAPANHVLLFQADSIICSNSPMTVDDFLKYDLIGAPIDTIMGHGYNGGLSLRNRNTVLQVINNPDIEEFAYHEGGGSENYEDQWFHTQMKGLPAKADGSPGANLPTEEVAMTFAVETLWSQRPLGYHQPERWQPEHMLEIEEWCPEVRMATADLMVSHDENMKAELEQQQANRKAQKASAAAAAAAAATAAPVRFKA